MQNLCIKLSKILVILMHNIVWDQVLLYNVLRRLLLHL